MTEKKKQEDPQVATAKRTIPRHKRAGRWVKAHKRDIILTLGTLAGLMMEYWWFRKRLGKQNLEFTDKVKAVRETEKSMEGVLKISEKASENVSEAADAVRNNVSRIQGLKERMSLVEKTLHDPKFRQYLKERHGITDLKGVGRKK